MNRLIFGKYFFDRTSETSELFSSVRIFLFSGRLRNSTYGMIGPVGGGEKELTLFEPWLCNQGLLIKRFIID